MNDKKRFALAARIQKRIQENDPNFWLIKRRNEIKKKLKEKMIAVAPGTSMKKNKRRRKDEKNIFFDYYQYGHWRVQL